MSAATYEMRSATEVMKALDQASNGVQKASTRLMRLSQEFHEAHVDEGGQIVMGIGVQFESALRDELAFIYESAIEDGRRAPAEDIREAMAHRAVQAKRPDLWAEYHAKKSEIDALKIWIRNQRDAISANQSILRGERA
jgi:hypothetical protein